MYICTYIHVPVSVRTSRIWSPGVSFSDRSEILSGDSSPTLLTPPPCPPYDSAPLCTRHRAQYQHCPVGGERAADGRWQPVKVLPKLSKEPGNTHVGVSDENQTPFSTKYIMATRWYAWVCSATNCSDSSQLHMANWAIQTQCNHRNCNITNTVGSHLPEL